MKNIKKSVFVEAPLEKVFAFMAEPNNFPKIWPGLLEIKNVQPLPRGGYCHDWAYEMAGILYEGQAEWIQFVKNQRIVTRSEIGISCTFEWNYHPEAGGTRITMNVEYDLPAAVLGKLAAPLLDEISGSEAETILANLKAQMEG